ncbi:ThiF family adenylyltransferase [Bacteroidales bacterium OttesenSCG-928-B11]|nr:ThiF family adenylyltransferase [Bacteroidales bacterium OttesenSCG-928-E04]MDL2308410.1 ThiF family adenylyltransferase [Bacteroidales bacterium OttesenSCG-928-C03]MDL2311274.1 ThiF family adenylyltransferase [Bacteroidales bacterium OttesenSCG-928-B11]
MNTNDQTPQKEWGKEVYTLLSWFEMDKVKNASVMVVGAGALGNEVLKNLALFGVGSIFIVDFDTIEYSNLTRSILFRESDCDRGLYKAAIAAERVREINPNVNVNYICGNLATDVGLGIYKKMDVVISCLDSRLARLQLNRICMRANVPWVDGAIENLEGKVKVFVPGENCFECELSENARNHLFQRLSCAGIARRNMNAGRVPTTPVIASIIGAVQVQEAMKLIHKEQLAAGAFTSLCKSWFHYEGMHLGMKIYKGDVYDEDCASHEYWQDIISYPELSADTTIRELLDMVQQKTGSSDVTINLRNDKFVDKIVTRSDNLRFEPMLPESKIPHYIESNYELFRRLPGDLYQKAYENIDFEFPYPELTLRQIGIPDYDILQVSTDSETLYIELSADENIHFKNE